VIDLTPLAVVGHIGVGGAALSEVMWGDKLSLQQ
jgi:hypothetical protein